MEPTLLLREALRVARKMGSDPEFESIAGEAVVYAMQDFKEGLGQSILQFTRVKTRQGIWRYMRDQRLLKRDCRRACSGVEPLDCDDEFDETPTHPDFNLLVERYINGVAEWSLARREGISTYAMHKRIEAARDRFLQYMGAL